MEIKISRERLVERFLRYVSVDTQSDPQSETFPSTAKQLTLLNLLLEEMLALGLSDAEIDPHGYVTGTVPATPGHEEKPVIGLISHVDTSPDMAGAGVKPQFVQDYDGNDIRLNDTLTMRVADFPELAFFKGHTLITTDGTTLLGADDKAGVAEIMTAVEYLMAHPEIPHGKLRIGFTPDEEVGRGVDFFDVEAFGAQFAYTVDGGFEGELEYENFNAAMVRLVFKGRNFHPGYAKNKMVNSMKVAYEFISSLPKREVPELTSGYEGFFHLYSIKGTVEETTVEILIRDFDRENFEWRKGVIENGVRDFSRKYELPILLELKDQYANMREKLEPLHYIVDIAKQAMNELEI